MNIVIGGPTLHVTLPRTSEDKGSLTPPAAQGFSRWCQLAFVEPNCDMEE